VNGPPGLAAIELEGGGARQVLRNSSRLDLHPDRFPVGSCTRTWLAKLPVFIAYVDATPRFELYVASSYLPYLRTWFHAQADRIEPVP